MNNDSTKAFNAAVDFALDSAGDDGLVFLSMWREGDWDGISKEFPAFDLGTTGQQIDARVEAPLSAGMIDEYPMPKVTLELDSLLNMARSTRDKT